MISGFTSCFHILLVVSPELAVLAPQQAAGSNDNPPRPDFPRGPMRGRPVSFENSPRLRGLIRSGNLYLSLSDALALAIENNLDIELQRFSFPVADSDVLRACGRRVRRGGPFVLA